MYIIWMYVFIGDILAEQRENISSSRFAVLTFPSVSKITLVVLPILLTGWLSELQGLDPCYHTPEQLITELRALQEDYPDWVRVDSIGHSSQYHRPIWMARLTDNPDDLEPEPALLFVGQVHAEEVVGIEIVFRLMRNLLDSLDFETPRARLENLDLYFIPTLNPEGLEVVHSGLDATFRKNCRDNIGDGVFRYRPGWGWDTSGVDLNRNFALHWENGDTLFRRGGLEGVYNYYRGPAPFSEPEARALRDLALNRRFLYSAVYHGSRSGANSETIIAPWNWDGKVPPDAGAIDAILNEVAWRTPTIDDQTTYLPVHAMQRNGQTQDWFYQAAGTFQYMIEVGNHVQPDSANMELMIADNIPGALFLMDLARGAEGLGGFGALTVLAFNSETGQPIRAKVSIEGISQPLLAPRYCADNGRLDWFLPTGEQVVFVTAEGCEPREFDGIEIISRQQTVLEVDLMPAALAQIVFQARDLMTHQSLAAVIKLDNAFNQHRIVCLPGLGNNLALPVGVYRAEVTAEGYLPIINEIHIREGHVAEFLMNSADMIFDEDFESMGEWERGGVGQNWSVIESDGRSVLTDSPQGPYSSRSTAWLQIPFYYRLQPQRGAALRLIHKPNFEPGYDFAEVVAWDEELRAWMNLASFSQFPEDWDTTYIDITGLSAEEVLIRFQITADGSLEEDGWLIDRVTVFAGKYERGAPSPETAPMSFNLSACPNPFNAQIRIVFTLEDPRRVRLNLNNMLGQRMFTTTEDLYPAGVHVLSVDAAGWPSGTYFLNYDDDRLSRVVPLKLVK